MIVIFLIRAKVNFSKKWRIEIKKIIVENKEIKEKTIKKFISLILYIWRAWDKSKKECFTLNSNMTKYF